MKDCAVIILAAGNSSRMGKPKFLLKTQNGNTFLEFIVEQYIDFGCSETIVVLNKKGSEALDQKAIKLPETTKCIVNDHVDYGQFYSIQQGLSQANCAVAFIHNIDNPFAHKGILEQLYQHQTSADYIKPVNKGQGGHPILLSEKVIQSILKEKDNTLHTKEFLQRFTFKKVKTNDPSILTNINTHEEYLEFYHRKTR